MTEKDIDQFLRAFYKRDKIIPLKNVQKDETPVVPSRKFIQHMRLMERDPIGFLKMRARKKRRQEIKETLGAAILLALSAVGAFAILFGLFRLLPACRKKP